MSLLKKTTKHGSVSRMYQSVDHIGVSYLQLGADPTWGQGGLEPPLPP